MIRKLSLFLVALVATTNIACADETPAVQKSERRNVGLIERFPAPESKPELTPESIQIERWALITTYYDSYFRTCLLFAEDDGPTQFACKTVLLGELYELERNPVLSKVLSVSEEHLKRMAAEKPKHVNRSEQIRTIYPTHTIVCTKDWEDGVRKVDECGDGEGSMKAFMQKFFAERVPEASLTVQVENEE